MADPFEGAVDSASAPATRALAVSPHAGVWAEHVSGEWREGVVTAAEVRIDGQRVLGARAAAIPEPVGGTTVDPEARSAIATILSALRVHGLIAS